ncbi:ATP-binding protein [Herbaspirillum huttiense]|uniref:sensor histidine kinase n=1 Tax=Herbaspirillum huttiense TaxID=863372 RepID=UPI0037F7F60F
MADKYFKVDAKTVLTLGRNSIKDATTAVVELVKNAYDADADRVDLSIKSEEAFGTIIISDNGHGMSADDIENAWLRIGFSGKVLDTKSPYFERRKTGEKGIGRLSADRLGEVLQIKTKKNESPSTGLIVDWNLFEMPGQEIGQIKLRELSNCTPKTPPSKYRPDTQSGTELTITKLRQVWSADDIEKLHHELTLLLPPYPEIAKTFSIKFHNDIDAQYNGTIRYGSRTRGEIELAAKLSTDGSLSYTMTHFSATDRNRRVTTKRTIPWSELAPDAAKARKKASASYLGDLEIRLSFFVRRNDLLEGTGLSLKELKQYLGNNAGVKIYRDMVRVKPYGDPNGSEADWLGLGQRKISDPAGARRSSFKIAPNQLVGAVFAGRDTTPLLVDSSSREGLIENDAFRQLKVILLRCINLIESKYHEISSQQPKQSSAARAQESVKKLSGNLSSLTVELSDLQKRITEDYDDDFAAVTEQINLVIEQAQAAQKEIDELADQSTVFRGLATVGIASAIFGHETATSITQADAKVRIATKLLEKSPPDIAKSVGRLGEATQYMERVASWGKFALSRVNKDKRQRRRISVSQIVTSVLNDIEGPMSSANVELKRSVADGIEAKTFPMDIEAVLINFMTNAYHEVKRHVGDRVIRVRLSEKKIGDRDGFELSVADNGHGIPPEHAQSIWEPLFSTKTDERGKATGTGLGLAIIKSAVDELGGEVGLRAKGPMGGAIFSAWFPKGIK